MEQQIRFCTTSDGVRIAYATAGQGPPLIIAPSWISHLEVDWNLGRDFFESLATHHLLVRYDKRGTGLSDRGVGDYSPEAHVRDLEAITDALGLRPVVLLGTSQGGPICITYAARHPENVSHLIVYGGFHNGTTAYFRQLVDAFVALIRVDWGGYGAGAMIDVFIAQAPPELRDLAADYKAFRSLMAEYQRGAATAEDAAATWLTVFEFNVTDLLPKVRVPTLVLHRRDDQAVPFQQGREIAAGIPGARFVPLDGDIHYVHLGDTEPVIEAIEDFLLGEQAPRPARRVADRVHTILFTDMKGSTTLTQSLGDAGAQDVVRTHNGIVRGALSLHGGSEIKHTGDGIMASFAAASRALQCAIAIQRAFAHHNESYPETPIRVRIGLNAGEPVAEDADLFGTAVQLAARVCAQAQPGQVLVPEGVRHLVAGKGFLFSDQGAVALRGFEDPVRLYEVRWANG